MNVNKRYIAGAASAMVLALGLTACGGSGSSAGGAASGSADGNADGESTAAAGGPEQCGATSTDPISWMTMLHTPTTPADSGPVTEALKEHTGEDFTIQWVPDASKEEKINATLSSGTLADLTSLTLVTTSTTVRNALNSGMFWDVEPYLEQFDNLKNINPQTIEVGRVGGKLYGVPFQKPIARYGVLVRQDWLDELGLEVPHTLEEIEAVAREFKDKKGGAIIDRAESFLVGFPKVAGYFGSGDKFEVDENGDIVSTYGTDAWKEAMEWYQGLYADGLINQEFVTTQKQNQQDAIAQDKGGIVFTGLMEARNYNALAENADPNTPMEWAFINDVTWGDVPRRIVSDTNGGFGGLLSISKDKVKCEEDVLRILGFIDSLMDEEAFSLMTNGVEGVHFNKSADGVIEIIDQTKWEQDVQPFSSSRPSELVTTFKNANENVNKGNELIADNAEFAVINPAQALDSETYNKEYSLVEQAINDAYNKFIMGQISMADYEKVIADQEGKTLGTILEEFNASKAEAEAAKTS